ncbi:hypothetical protein G3M48_006001 [Beauveria asiatica]|uniref:ADP-ribosylation factor n=1 Tax=Beauveria asiatica TaxID=1069075 RepID=A0AAW0RQM5_9HYPO
MSFMIFIQLGKCIFWHTNERRVMLLGVDYAGKTTLLCRWLVGEIVTTMPTIGFNVETINHPAGYAFTVWDVGGERTRLLA